MGAQPKKKWTKARQGKRRKAIQFSLKQLVKCPNCQQEKLPHKACQNCGTYKGIAVSKKEEVKVKRVEDK